MSEYKGKKIRVFGVPCLYCKTNLAKVKFCSKVCANKYNANNLSIQRMGENNPAYGKKPANYKGGTNTLSGSRKVNYIEVRVNGKRMKQHRYIMEQFLGRSLSKDEVIHHKDGNGMNNEISNLLLLPSNREHRRVHALKEVMSP